MVYFSWSSASDYQTIKKQAYLSSFQLASKQDHFIYKKVFSFIKNGPA
jgi:hypothetical protein